MQETFPDHVSFWDHELWRPANY